MPELHLLAYALKEDGAPRIAAWCPWCKRLHYHGYTASQRERRCGGDQCFGHPFGSDYALVCVGRLAPSQIPKLTVDETLKFSRLLERAFAIGNAPAQTKG